MPQTNKIAYNSRKLIYESTTESKSKIQIYKSLPVPLPKSLIQIPKWFFYLLIMFIILLGIVLLTAIIVVFNAPRAGQYLESCDGRSCQSGLNLKCIDKVCKCESNKYYEKSCVSKKFYGERCSYSYECLEDKGLNCFNGKCQCGKLKYWSNGFCRNRYSYGEFCEDDQCLSAVMLSCIDDVCQCDETRFWNNQGCIRKRNIGDRCFNDIECNQTQLTTCYNGLCDCKPIWQYYDPDLQLCLPKVNESQPCTSSYQCLGEMLCLDQICNCSAFFYFEISNNTCIAQVMEGESCFDNKTCRGDLGLICLNNVCKCESKKQFWNSTTCRDYYEYGQIGCNSDNECSPNRSLICNSELISHSCNCPITSYDRMCDCPRSFGNETYWNSTHCVPANVVNSQCTEDYECQTITLGLGCNSSVCFSFCEIGWSYFNGKCYKIFLANGNCIPLADNTGCDENDIIPKCQNQNSLHTSQLAILSKNDTFYFVRSIDTDFQKNNFIGAYIGGYWQGTGTPDNPNPKCRFGCDWSVDCGGCTNKWMWIDGSEIITGGSLNVWCGQDPQGPHPNNDNHNEFDFCVRIGSNLNCFENGLCEEDKNFICEYTV